VEISFNIEKVTAVEFGIGCNDDQYFSVPVDTKVQGLLRDMVKNTIDAMRENNNGPKLYDPSEKHETNEYLFLPKDNELAAYMNQLHEAANIKTNTKALSSNIVSYFARMKDEQDRRVTALRRATQFKGFLKSQNRLVSWVDDTLRIVETRLFKLDYDFDLLMDNDNLHILRPSSFEFAGKLQEALLAAVPNNIAEVQTALPFVDLSNVIEYLGKHTRAARYLASIKSQKEAENIDINNLKDLCARTQVEIQFQDGKIHVDEVNILDFLEVLDRRRYIIELVKDNPEAYKAPSREPVPRKTI
jgi:hypothetical protein